MRQFAVVGVVVLLVLPGVAYAQTSDATGYVQGVAQSAFGNVTSQSFGAEAGYFLTPQIGIFAEGGFVRDTAPSELGAAAQKIASGLTQVATSAVGYSVRQPVSFGAAGARYAFAGTPKVQPYVLGGFGAANVKKDVTFTVGGADVTNSLASAPYYTTLGSDLAGISTRPMLVIGGGVTYHGFGALRIDLGYRYSRIFTDTTGTNVNRAGIGAGFTF
jgi:opacity protein-like surface antigen